MSPSEKRANQILNYNPYSLKKFRLYLNYVPSMAERLVAINGGGEMYYMLDMIYSYFRFGAIDTRDYLIFEFYKKNHKERDKYFTKGRYFKVIKKFNKEIFTLLFDKAFQYQYYKEFIHRKWLLATSMMSDSEIMSFLSHFEKVLIKPLSSEQGRGIYKLDITNQDEVSEFIEQVKHGDYLIEELVENCAELKLFNENSLNTIRVYTIVKKDGSIEIVNMDLRCGCNNNVVDNWGVGGVGYNINLKYGIIDGAGVDKKGNRYIYHPGTNIQAIGYNIPYFDKIQDFCKRIIEKDKRVVYAGLDIAITPNGLELIEVNFPGGHDFLQAVDRIPKYDKIKSIYK